MSRRPGFLLGLIFVLAAGLSGPVQSAVIQVTYGDSAGFGFNDPQSVSPVPGNPGTTLGQQRRAVMEAAADIWASRLDSAIAVRVRAEFDDLECGDETTLGLGGTTGLARNFDNAPMSGINFPLSLATALSGQRFSGFSHEMRVSFNFRIDLECLDGIEGYWYGLDPAVPPAAGTISFLELVLHELGHGLGFTSLTDRDTREFLGQPPAPDIMSVYLYDLGLERSWREMTPAQRVSSSTSGPNLVWIGPETNERAAERLLPPGQVQTNPAIGGTSDFAAWIQGFPPYPALTGLTGQLVLADGPGPASTSDPWHRSLACEPLANADEVRGRIALVRRGECTFSEKLQVVHDAGAIGMVLSDNQPDGSEEAIARDRGIALDRYLLLPIWLVPSSTGDVLRSALPGLEVTLGYDLATEPRGTTDGFVQMQASPDTTGSNVSHFSNTMTPPSLMNPSVSNVSFDGDLDFVPEFMYDIGWQSEAAKRAQFSGAWFNPDRDGEGCLLTFEQGQDRPVLTCYLYRDGEQFWLIGAGTNEGNWLDFPEMIITEGADYGEAFDPSDVVRTVWGEISMQLLDCNTARMAFNPFDPDLAPLHTNVTRLIPTNCNRRADQQIDRSFNRTYMARDGEGIQVARESNGTTWVMTFYTYLEGNQVWVIGSGRRTGDRIHFDEVTLTRGGQWGADFDPADVERIDFGTITLDIIDCNNLQMTIEPVLPQFEPAEYVMTRVVPGNC